MQVLKTTSPLTPASPTGAPKSTPSKTAPDSRARRPTTPGGTLAFGTPAECWRGGGPPPGASAPRELGTQNLQAGDGCGHGRLVDEGHVSVHQGEQHAAAQVRADHRRVARQRAHPLPAHRPLPGRTEEHTAGPLPRRE